MSTALEICANAYRQANMDSNLTSFSTTQSFPYNIAMDLLNEVIGDINRAGDLFFLETSVSLTYTPGDYDYDLSSSGLDIDPRKIKRLERSDTSNFGELHFVNYVDFRRLYRTTAISTQMPHRYSVYNQTLELDTIPDQDYSLKLYYFSQLDPVTMTTDTFTVPPTDEDVLRQGVYAYLLQRMGRPDFGIALQMYQARLKGMRAEMKRSTAAPKVMPAAF